MQNKSKWVTTNRKREKKNHPRSLHVVSRQMQFYRNNGTRRREKKTV